jgi:hypothetical protein
MVIVQRELDPRGPGDDSIEPLDRHLDEVISAGDGMDVRAPAHRDRSVVHRGRPLALSGGVALLGAVL